MKRDLFVYIVESPSPEDIFEGTSEGGMISQALELEGIPSVVRTVVDDRHFLKALHEEFASEITKRDNAVPVLHISAHGNKAGFSLSNSSRYRWATFGASLRSLNRAMDGALLLCMSCCEGYSVAELVRQFKGDEEPYAALVGSHGKPTWSETLLDQHPQARNSRGNKYDALIIEVCTKENITLVSEDGPVHDVAPIFGVHSITFDEFLKNAETQ